MEKEEYEKLVSPNWNLKEETIDYLKSDLISLLQIMYEFSNNMYDSHEIQVSECLTITSIAVKVFLNNHYTKKLPLITQPSVYEDIKQAYYGGLSDVYTPYGENLFYYDVNSLYPQAALYPMPSNTCKYMESFDDEGFNLNKHQLFGFFYCDVKTTHGYMPILPLRINGLLTYPEGEFSG